MRAGKFRSPLLSDLLSLSADLRVAAMGTVSEATPRTAIEVEEANIEAALRLVPEVLSLYVDQTVGPNTAATREIFGLLENLPANGFVKAGKFFLPYGLRLVDDIEYIRLRSGFSYDTPDQGIEVGIEPGPLSLFVALTNGTQGATENDSKKQITGTAAVVLQHIRVGASASRNDGVGSRRDVVGGFGGFNLGRLTVLGEVDLILDESEAAADVEQLAAYVEGNLLLARGLNAKVTYGFLDPNREIGENAQTRMRFGLATGNDGYRSRTSADASVFLSWCSVAQKSRCVNRRAMTGENGESNLCEMAHGNGDGDGDRSRSASRPNWHDIGHGALGGTRSNDTAIRGYSR
jgi:hypothetical protein